MMDTPTTVFLLANGKVVSGFYAMLFDILTNNDAYRVVAKLKVRAKIFTQLANGEVVWVNKPRTGTFANRPSIYPYKTQPNFPDGGFIVARSQFEEGRGPVIDLTKLKGAADKIIGLRYQ